MSTISSKPVGFDDNWNSTPYQVLLRVDMANGVLISLALETLPTTMYLVRCAMAVVALCVQSLRVLAILAWIALTRFFCQPVGPWQGRFREYGEVLAAKTTRSEQAI